jgi:Zn-dependent protease
VFGSFTIGRIFGITIRVHWLFLALIVLIVSVSSSPWWLSAGGTLMLFAIVVLHELGHSLVAKRFGIQVLDITLWPLGGMARMSEMPENPKVEALVAIAGPAVNFVLSAATLALVVALGFGQHFAQPIARVLSGTPWLVGASWFITMNLVIGTFNLVPAFPMDGGRILRAVLALWHDWVRATEIAVTVGRVIAVAMIVTGTLLPQISLVLIGLFVFWAGARELWGVRIKHGRLPFGRGMRVAFDGQAQSERAAPDRRPAREDAIPSEPGDPASGARRPLSSWRGRAFGHERLSDDAIARMERFQGRLIERPEAGD